MRPAGAAPRLHRELLTRLLLPLLALVAASGVAATWFMQRLADGVFDQWLLDAASSLAAEIHFDDGRATLELPPAAHAMLAYDEVDEVTYRVVQGAAAVAGDASLPLQGGRPVIKLRGSLYDAVERGMPVRVALVRAPGPPGAAAAEVRVAETLHKRERMRADVLVLLLPLGLLLLSAAAAISYAVRRTLRPVADLAGRWRAHSYASLDLIDTGGVPHELMPFATALNELLARLNAMLTRERQFSANVAHQLRTPLAGLLLGLSRAEESADVATARATIAEMKATTQRLSRLVQQLLALGRIGHDGSHSIEFQLTDLVALVQEIGAGFAERAARRGIALELDVPPGPLVIRVHPDLLSEALSNLLDNAIRHTPRGGTVAVSFGTDPPAVIVTDSGPGISEEQRGRVLERFARGSAGDGIGSGLGLAIVREIARLHGGDILLCAGPQGGLQAVLSFPAAAAGNRR